jgi:hypothetical protein
MKSDITMDDGREFHIECSQIAGEWGWAIFVGTFRVSYGTRKTLKGAMAAAHNHLVDDLLDLGIKNAM